MTAKQFVAMVRELFKRGNIPTIAELYQALVPDGCKETAEPDENRFPHGVYKYRFMSSDGINLMVKYHGPDMNM